MFTTQIERKPVKIFENDYKRVVTHSLNEVNEYKNLPSVLGGSDITGKAAIKIDEGDETVYVGILDQEGVFRALNKNKDLEGIQDSWNEIKSLDRIAEDIERLFGHLQKENDLRNEITNRLGHVIYS